MVVCHQRAGDCSIVKQYDVDLGECLLVDGIAKDCLELGIAVQQTHPSSPSQGHSAAIRRRSSASSERTFCRSRRRLIWYRSSSTTLRSREASSLLWSSRLASASSSWTSSS